MKNGKGGQSATTKKPVGALLCGLLCLGAPALGATTVTKITYDAGDRVVSVTDPRNLVTTYTYDGLGQLWQQASPDTGTTSYGYNAYGRRTSMTRADGTVTSYGYDTLNRPTSVTAGGLTQLATYDSCTNGLDRLCTASDSTGSTSYTYTPEGWLAGRGFSIAGTTYALGYGYDPMGHLATVNYPDGHEATYSYADGVVSGVTLNIGGNSVAGASAVSYRPGDLAMAGWTSSNGLSNTLGYDSDGRLTGISVPNVQSLAIGYDKADRIASITNSIDPGQSAGFDYDDQSRLTGAYGVADTESYAYDLDGNRIGQTVNGASTSFNINATSNRLMGVSGATTMTYGYDAQGNTTAVNGATVNQYNPFNRLSSASGASDYVNPQGQRLRKVSSAGTTYFAPEGGALLAESDNGTWIDYVWLNGRLIGRVSGSTVDAIHDDQTGRPQVVTDAGGAVVWKANNYPFTQAVTLDNIGGLNLGFPGQYYDAERGTWNNGFRDYDSSLGRYIESDPIGLVGGVNTYAYVGNDPLNFVDLLGLWPGPPPMGPFPSDGPGRIPEAGDIPSNIPGGPWASAGPGQRLGAFFGPKQSSGPKAQCQYVPREGEGGPPGSTGYWKTKTPGQDGWSRYDLNGNPITPEVAHPGPTEPIELPGPVEPVEPIDPIGPIEPIEIPIP